MEHNNSRDDLLAACKAALPKLALLHRIIVDPPWFADNPAGRKPTIAEIEKCSKQVNDAIAADKSEAVKRDLV